MEPVHNLYIPSILCEFTHEIIVSSSTNHRDIKILKVLKKKKKKHIYFFLDCSKQKKKREKFSPFETKRQRERNGNPF